MVIVTESMEIKEGRYSEAVEHFKKASAYVRKTFGVDAKILRRVTPRAGEGQRRVAMLTFDTLTAWAEYQSKLASDPQWQALMDESFRSEKKCFVHNSVSRTIYEVM